MHAANYLSELEKLFAAAADPAKAKEMKKYMRDLFEFYGIKTPERKELTKIFFTLKGLPEKKELGSILKVLWNKSQREYQYFGMRLLDKFTRQLTEADINLIEYLIVNKSWWDTVDFLAINPVGSLLFSKNINQTKISTRWINSDNIWLKRTAILFQLKYKKNTDLILLESFIEKCHQSGEFFIQKAMGWALREYSKTNPDYVSAFVRKKELPSLTRREALKVINK